MPAPWRRLPSPPERVALSQPSTNGAHAVDQTIDFLLTGIASTPGAHQPIGYASESFDDRGGVEVAIRHEDAAFRERDRNVVGRSTAHSKGDGWRPRRTGLRAVHRDTVDCGQAGPEET